MAQKILILGNSGTGKSASMRNFSPDEITVISCAGKPLPFRNSFEIIEPRFDSLSQDVLNAMDQSKKKVIVIDDAQYIMSFQYMRRINEPGWNKWNDIQGDFFNIIQAVDYMPDDVIVYFLSHISTDENGNEKIKTMGKMLDEKITIEGLFTTVLKTNVADGKYYFLTQNNGKDTVKSPIGMFDSYAIDNDLKYVDTKIRNYYQIGNYAPDDEVKAMDAEHIAPEIEKPDADGRKRRRRKKEDAKEVVADEKENNKEEKPEQAPAENEKETAADEKPKRRRKQRESVANTPESVAEQAENVADTPENCRNQAENVADEEKPKRRRRRKASETAEDITAGFGELRDDDIPF